jgi:hypothetical protein
MPKVSKSKPVRRASGAKARKRAAKGVPSNGQGRLTGQFFAPLTLEELAKTQGIGPMKNPEQMAGGWPGDEDVDEFVKETYQSRG